MLKEKRVVIVAARFNNFIVRELIEGAKETLIEGGIENIAVERVPGSFEIPLLCKILLTKEPVVDAIIALGVIIRGETNHFDILSHDVSGALLQLSLQFSKPIGWGIVTADNTEQALARAGIKMGNKGCEAAHAVLEMLKLTAVLNLS
jgi:6,7-dimethyl-8-ribityllumazine synthase